MSAGENRSRSRSKSRQGREIRIPRPWRIFRFTIFLSFLGINHLAQGRGDLESATLASVCFRRFFSRIFQGRADTSATLGCRCTRSEDQPVELIKAIGAIPRLAAWLSGGSGRRMRLPRHRAGQPQRAGRAE